MVFFSAVVVVAVVMAKYRRLSIEIDSHANYNENGSERKEEKSSFFLYKRKIWPMKNVQHIRIWAIIICQRHIKWIVLFYSVSFHHSFFLSFNFIVTTVRIIIIHMIAVAALNRFGWKWWKWWWWCNIYSTFEGILFTYDIIRPSHVHYFLFCSFPQSTQIDLSLYVSDACINTPCKPSKSNDFNYFSSSDCHSLLGHALTCSNKPIFAKFYSLQYFGCCMEY